MENNASIRIIVVDDHEIFRQGISAVVAEDNDISIVGEASDGVDALELVAQSQPDVVLLDIKMPRLGGLDVCMRINENHPDVKVLIVTASDREEDLLAAIAAGAHGLYREDTSRSRVSGDDPGRRCRPLAAAPDTDTDVLESVHDTHACWERPFEKGSGVNCAREGSLGNARARLREPRDLNEAFHLRKHR